MITGSLLLSAACGDPTETAMMGPTPAAAEPSAAASSASMDPTTPEGEGDPKNASEVNTSDGPNPQQAGSPSTPDTDGSAIDGASPDGANPEVDNGGVEEAGGTSPNANDDPQTSGADLDSGPERVEGEPPTDQSDSAEGASDLEAEPSQTDPQPDSMAEAMPTNPEPQTEDEAETQLTFAADIWPLWSTDRDPVFVYRGMGSYTGCADETAPCHGSANPGALLSMGDMETTYAQMMDTESTSSICEGTQRVAVGDPDQSCLVLFYEGRLGPQDLDWVDEAEIELMREWIRQGALP